MKLLDLGTSDVATDERSVTRPLCVEQSAIAEPVKGDPVDIVHVSACATRNLPLIRGRTGD